MRDLMVDIETLGNGKKACIVQIGACYFDADTGEIGETFKENIDPVSVEAVGGELDASTVMWWLSQSKEAQKSILEIGKDVDEVMTAFKKFAKRADNIWSHATFDFVIIQETFKSLGKGGLSFRAARDIRTLVHLANTKDIKFNRKGVHHDALDDAIFQVEYCHYAMQKLKGEGNVII